MESEFRISTTGDALPAKEVGIFCFWGGGDLGHHLCKGGFLGGSRICIRGSLGIVSDICCHIVDKIRSELGCGDGEEWIHAC